MITTAAPRIAVLTDSRGWQETRLCQAFKRRGTRPALISLTDCRIGSHLELPGFETALPDAVFVRAIPGGSFEQVTLRLDILHALQSCGVLVYNDARAIERTVDKAMTSFLLARAGVASARAWTCETEQGAREIARRETAVGRMLVLKPLFGSRGKGLKLVKTVADLPESGAQNGVYYLQTYIPGENAGGGETAGHDWRVMVIGGRAVAAMERRAVTWITNRARGGECLAALLSPELAGLAETATQAVGACYAGVDIVRDHAGNYWVLEVNGIPAWKGLQSVCPVDIAAALVNDVLARIPGQRIEAVS